MTQTADRVYTDPADIERLRGLIERLPDAGLVDIELIDGSRQSSVVTVRPSLQTFLDGDGNEGVNAVVRLDDPDLANGSRYLWVDEILDIRPIHSDERTFAQPPRRP
ncbi:DUF3247 family protein [Lysobacter capsici]|uniref:DUF3247 family protein n=1 Tax=Lysobacter capsici TaxID=435897 RepID=UPI001C0087FC|nr:DUF3247 family protein [Lysobacter capsici]QWF19470.1 DUF3247 family protein [Lysobacter capsici]